MLYSLFNEKYSDNIEDRKMFLLSHHIALYDVVEKCDIKASYDSSIKKSCPNGYRKIFKNVPKYNNNRHNRQDCSKVIYKYLLDKVNQDRIRIVMFPSTSSANAKMSTDDLVNSFKSLFK